MDPWKSQNCVSQAFQKPAILQMALSKDHLAKLRCRICQGYLSVPPIYMDKGTYTCGRCQPTGTRVDIYEELAKFMIFPCTYAHCHVQVPWGQVENHEVNCPNKVIGCPHSSCSELYEIKTLLSHFQNLHKDVVHPEKCTIPRKLRDMAAKNFNIDRKVLLLVHNSVPYIAMVFGNCTVDNNNNNRISGYYYSFGVFSLKESRDISYQLVLSIKSDHGSMTRTWDAQQIKQFNDRLHCLNCYGKNCTLLYHQKNNANFLRKIKIDKQPNLSITYTFKLEKLTHLPGSLSNLSAAQTTSLTSILECIGCRNYMCAPIYICAKGHSFCITCKRNIASCQRCRLPISDSRNVGLEEIADTVTVPCPNVQKGCKFVGLVRSTKQHVINCKYSFL